MRRELLTRFRLINRLIEEGGGYRDVCEVNRALHMVATWPVDSGRIDTLGPVRSTLALHTQAGPSVLLQQATRLFALYIAHIYTHNQ